MTAVPAVRVYDDLTAGEACIAHRAADDESTGRIDVVLHAGRIIEALRHDRLDNFFHDASFDLFVRDVGTVLGGNHDGIDPDRFPVAVLDGHLRFTVGTDPGKDVFLAHSASRRVSLCARTIGIGMSSVVSFVA